MNNKMHKCVGRSNCHTCQLRQTMVCSDVGLDDLLSFHTPIDDLVFTPGAVLYNMAETAQAVHCVRAGAVKLMRFDASGNQRIVRILQKNDVAGLEALFAGKYPHTAIAINEVRTCRIPMNHFQHFMAEHPRLQMRLLERSQAALLEVDQWLSDLVANTIPARVRLARLLLRLRVGDSDRIHRLSLADTGAILGLTPETLCRILQELTSIGVLIKAGKGMASRHYRGDIAALTLISQEA
jgi:CRP/FNR family transcriptional regulator